MLESLKRGGISDERVMGAMAEIPRHYFVPEAFRHQAYDDDVSIHIGEGQTISQPRIVALMTESARIDPQDRVLEVGTGSGYQAAVLSKLARFVFTVERVASLARQAKNVLDQLGVDNVSIKVMDGTLGWRAQAPFDAILVTAGAPEVPEPLVKQLADGGRLVVPVGPRETQVLKIVERRGDRTFAHELKGACFVPLIGRHGWEERSD
ncbi:MAG: protein-L-isoaspartate(D-aspartate) O-methyltransferase [Acidobacteria bacterium]|nr:protein-L-isoaspartate(D-aspartate) O-methyltransferase [Candidatus Sulfomarinibacter kjeldsenii]